MIGFPDDGPTPEKLDLAERVAKLPGAQIADVRAAAGLPELSGFNEWAGMILLNLPDWMDEDDEDDLEEADFGEDDDDEPVGD